ncbi:MAG: sensor histidine kinase [Bryobacteraceae bacterium]
MLFPLKFDWPGQIAWVRVLLAVATLGISYFYPVHSALLLFFYSLLMLYLALSLIVVARGARPGGMLGLLGLFGDTVYFLILASFGADRFWLASVFFLYLMAEALAFYGPVEVVVIVAVATVFCAVLPYSGARRLEPTVVVASTLTCGCAVQKRRRSARIEALSEKLEEVQKGAEKAREAERQRIASDFHDGPLQSFISLQMRLEILRKLLERDFQAGMQELMQLQALAQAQVRDLRVFLHSMRPVDMDGASLVATARRTAETFQKESGIPVTFLGTNAPVGLPQEMTGEVLQMLREALHNVQKHAGATRVAVTMEKTDRALEISVEDNGHGFNFAGTYTLEELEMLRLGPASLKRRARSLSADLQVESRPGRGAGLKFRIPLQ